MNLPPLADPVDHQALPDLYEAIGELTPEAARRVVVLLGLNRPRVAAEPQPQLLVCAVSA
ncbi:hypothetical protein ACEZDB_26905 [Streptacidiphilus sp. N1-3]|uniref:FXSXX-COOH protein n=1 Tax=Streptacidiphilus alkalitolerans TaxID=3342712 RepID=A0ABV6X7T9_9ACTN